jgi:membrane protein
MSADRLYQPLFWRFALHVYRTFLRNQGFENAKALTFTSLFSVVPLLTLMLALFAPFPAFRGFGDRIEELLLDHLLPSSGRDLQSYLEEFAVQAGNLTWIGGAMLLITAVLMLRDVESSFNRIWGVGEMRAGFFNLLLYWAGMGLAPVLLGLGLVISSYLTSLALFESFAELSGVIGARSAALELFPLLLTIGAFFLLYKVVPNCRVRNRHALAGATLVVAVLKVVQWGFTLSITTASYEFVYGTFAALPICLLWLYICWVVVLAGANLVSCLPAYGNVAACRPLTD